MFLETMPYKALLRLRVRIYDRLRDGMGFQPFGMDAPTMWAVKPETMKSLALVVNELNRRLKGV